VVLPLLYARAGEKQMKAISLIIIGVFITSPLAWGLSELETELADFQVQLRRDEDNRRTKTLKRGQVSPPAISAKQFNPVGDRNSLKKPPRMAVAPTQIEFDPGPEPVIATRKQPAQRNQGARRMKAKLIAQNSISQAPQTSAVQPPAPEPVVSEPAATLAPPPAYVPAEMDNSPVLLARGRTSSGKTSAPFIYRITALGFATISTFDGSDSKSVTSNVSNPYNGGFAGSVLADINLGSPHFVLEAGFQSMVSGAYTGYDDGYVSYYSNNQSEKLTLNYLGAPLNLKWMVSGQNKSTAFIKVGATPSYLYQSQYDTSSNLIQQNRFGQFSTFDVLLTAGGGFSFKAWERAHLVIDLGWYQGVLPISKYFDIYNMGFRVGAGVSYIL
jgi:hypothetical protein